MTSANPALTSANPAFKSKMTAYVVTCWILAAFGGLMFGYDIGISGGVSGMDDFLIKFFPHVYERKLHAKENNYCKFDDQMLQLFTSSLYLAALVASFGASKACTVIGRKLTILVAAAFFMAGAVVSAAAQVKWVLIIGRVLFGIGVGFGNEAVPLFLSEVAPVQHRGAVNILFQLFVTIGILIADFINYGVANLHPNGWRAALGLAGTPALVLFVGSFFITETPTSLVERGDLSAGKKALERIRGVSDVDAEYEQIKRACEQAKLINQPFKKLLRRESRPPLVIGMMLQVFQQFTGINAIMFYGPVLFQTCGFKSNASLLSAVILGGVNCLNGYWRDSTSQLETYRQPKFRASRDSGGARGLVRHELRVVVGPTRVVDPQRNLPGGDQDSGLCFRCQHKHALHLHHCPGVPVDALPLASLHILLLLRLDRDNGSFRDLPVARDQGRVYR
ncbi:hypothetical protein RHSIM_Rhsim04G0205400 [Rhododendron simsii]|uniref:Major facilitator superfamily (MFS) profile domain-containing protein n=1 Tax=Rhododendron simsii TaxID=118357 RepID=A0A834LSI7_RHOSS|nr:hypothetical protein RHSIM_Rhsim04G0205400 [Rhododendron simsii]